MEKWIHNQCIRLVLYFGKEIEDRSSF